MSDAPLYSTFTVVLYIGDEKDSKTMLKNFDHNTDIVRRAYQTFENTQCGGSPKCDIPVNSNHRKFYGNREILNHSRQDRIGRTCYDAFYCGFERQYGMRVK